MKLSINVALELSDAQCRALRRALNSEPGDPFVYLAEAWAERCILWRLDQLVAGDVTRDQAERRMRLAKGGQ